MHLSQMKEGEQALALLPKHLQEARSRRLIVRYSQHSTITYTHIEHTTHSIVSVCVVYVACIRSLSEAPSFAQGSAESAAALAI